MNEILKLMVEGLHASCAEMADSFRKASEESALLESAMVPLDKEAERVFKQANEDAWKGREACLWRRATEALKTAQQPLRISYVPATETTRERLVLIDHQGNQVVSMDEIDERVAQERWHHYQMLTVIDTCLEKLYKSIDVSQLITPTSELNINVQQMVDLVVGLRTGKRHGQACVDERSGLKLLRQLSPKTLEESRAYVVERTAEALRGHSEQMVEMMAEAYRQMIFSAGVQMTLDEAAYLVDNVQAAVGVWQDALAAFSSKQIKMWMEKRKNEEK